MTKRVAIIGATGYAGAELTALLERHPSVSVAALFRSPESRETAATPYDAIHPSLTGLEGPDVVGFDPARLQAAAPDCVFLATPNEISATLVPQLVDSGIPVIDLSGAFRLRNPAAYPEWYGFEHPRPDLLDESVYGLPEWCNGELRNARLVANPGCYATAVVLALRPLVPHLDPEQAIVCDAASGVSGAGRKSDVSYSFSELAGNFKAYGVGNHRHTPEIRQNLPIGWSVPFFFVPHLLPTVRGILATLYLSFAHRKESEAITAAYEQAYHGKPFVTLRKPGVLPELKNVVGTPRCEIGFSLVDYGRRAVVVSVIDNLLKGAASQAVQNFNRVFGFDEKEGLA
ncbi:MAG: N-acetyl-gamma-glutamyl-phosphate reductase [Thermoanaerobaculia bacterium]